MPSHNLENLQRLIQAESLQLSAKGKLPTGATAAVSDPIVVGPETVGWFEDVIVADELAAAESDAPARLLKLHRETRPTTDPKKRAAIVKAAVAAAEVQALDRNAGEEFARTDVNPQTPSIVSDKGPQYGRGDVPCAEELKVLGNKFETEPKPDDTVL